MREKGSEGIINLHIIFGGHQVEMNVAEEKMRMRRRSFNTGIIGGVSNAKIKNLPTNQIKKVYALAQAFPPNVLYKYARYVGHPQNCLSSHTEFKRSTPLSSFSRFEKQTSF